MQIREYLQLLQTPAIIMANTLVFEIANVLLNVKRTCTSAKNHRKATALRRRRYVN